MFAMGTSGEFGRSLELHKSIVAKSTDEELRALPKNGLPWVCRPDMLFFRTMTNGIGNDTGYNAYEQLRGHFPAEQLRSVISNAAGTTSRHNVLLAGRKTWMQMSLPQSQWRTMLPVSRQVFKDNAFLTLNDMCKHCEDAGNDVWIVGGRELIMSALVEHSLGDLRVDNMFISTIANAGPSDILLDREKIMAYIDSDFAYNDEYAENNEVLIQRFRGKHK
uniref:Dihydrofolate reductase n=2 Tax=unclassified Rosemountvirus TaxID=2738372 RepID=A0AAU8GJJ0_9CAUD